MPSIVTMSLLTQVSLFFYSFGWEFFFLLFFLFRETSAESSLKKSCSRMMHSCRNRPVLMSSRAKMLYTFVRSQAICCATQMTERCFCCMISLILCPMCMTVKVYILVSLYLLCQVQKYKKRWQKQPSFSYGKQSKVFF